MTAIATPVAKTTAGQIADAIIAAAETPAGTAAILGVINGLEGGLETFLTNTVNNVKPTGAILPLVWDALKPTIVGELTALETANPGTVLLSMLENDATAWAKSIGG
jgi:hypothetical protein